MKAYKGFNQDMTCRGFQYKDVVYDIAIERVKGHYWCDIDAYSPGVNCTPDGCYYYRKGEGDGR